MVAPQNLSFNKRAIKANEQNHIRVMDSVQSILSKHDEKEARRLRGLSLESEAKKRAVKKPPNIERTEALMNEIKQNKGGHSVNGRTLRQPDYEMYKRMAKKQ